MTRTTQICLTRRAAVATGAAALGAPFLAPRPAHAQAGLVRIYTWRDYLHPDLIDRFERETGIQVRLSTYGSNDELETTLRNRGGAGFDVVFPSMANVASYDDPDAPGGSFLSPLDMDRIDMTTLLPGLARTANDARNAQGARVLIPFAWGTEGILLNRDIHGVPNREVSYGNLWEPEVAGRAALRPHTALIGVGLYLERIGVLNTNQMRAPAESEDDARRIYSQIARWIIQRKENIGALWNTLDQVKEAFEDKGCTIGQVWDGAGLTLRRAQPNLVYRAPREGFLGWMDGVAIPSGAQNIDQAYRFLTFLLDPRNAALFAQRTGYNSAVTKAVEFMSEGAQRQFADVYPPEVIGKIWWWRAESTFVSEIRREMAAEIADA